MKMNKLMFTGLAVAAIVAQPFYAVMQGGVARAASSTVVKPGDMQGWTTYTTTSGAVEFVGKADAPYGMGAAKLTTINDVNSRAQLISTTPAGTLLSDVTSLSYWSFVDSASFGGGSVSLSLGIDLDGDLSTTTDRLGLNHEPYWADASPDAAPVAHNVWQEWDVTGGTFWANSTKGGFIAGAGGPPLYSLATAKTMAPNAVITSITAYIGSYNPAYITYVDGVSLNGVTYDFEEATAVTNLNTGAVYGDLQSAVDASNPGDTLRINENLTLASDVDITKSLTIDGNGKTITAGAGFVKTGNDNNSLLSVLANDVTIKNITLDGVNPVTNQLHGINAYQVTNLLVDGVTAKNFRTGILYNGSTGTIQNVHTIDNIWHGINIDKDGANVNVLGTNTHTETLNIYVDDTTKNVTVNAPGYDSHDNEVKPNDRVYTLKVVDENTGNGDGEEEEEVNGGGNGSTTTNTGNGEVPTTSVATPVAATTDEPIVAVAGAADNKATEADKDADVLGDDQATDTSSAQDSKKEWSLVNLLLAAVATVMSVITLAGIRGSQGKQRNLRLLTLVPAVVAIVALLTVEDFTAGLGWVNGWTLLFAAIAIAQVALMASTKTAEDK